jgi:hypothetical protein
MIRAKIRYITLKNGVRIQPDDECYLPTTKTWVSVSYVNAGMIVGQPGLHPIWRRPMKLVKNDEVTA